MNTDKCARCGADMEGWRGFLEVYDASLQKVDYYSLCPSCQTYIAREIRKMVGGE